MARGDFPSEMILHPELPHFVPWAESSGNGFVIAARSGLTPALLLVGQLNDEAATVATWINRAMISGCPSNIAAIYIHRSDPRWSVPVSEVLATPGNVNGWLVHKVQPAPDAEAQWAIEQTRMAGVP